MRAFDLVGMALGDISGLVVGSGLVVTNAQMLRGAETFVVVVSDGAQEFTAEIRSLDERSGVAILEAERLSTTGARFALDDPNEDPEQGDVVYVPRFAGDGSLDDLTARGLIAEVRRLEPDLQGERALLLYRHNAAITAREYGMPMLNDCGEVIGLIRSDPDMSLRDLNDRSDPGESTFGVAGAEIRRALATLDTEVETAETPCLDANATVEQQEERARQLEDDAQLARDAAAEARREAEEARAQAREAQTRAAALEAANLQFPSPITRARVSTQMALQHRAHQRQNACQPRRANGLHQRRRCCLDSGVQPGVRWDSHPRVQLGGSSLREDRERVSFGAPVVSARAVDICSLREQRDL